MQKPDILPGSFAFRLSCYQEFGWTPDQVRRIPMSEARLLAVYFEETSLYHAEMADESRRGSRSSSSYAANDYGMETDSVIGGDDEIDAFEAQKRARRQQARR